MTRFSFTLALLGSFVAYGYEYPLQFTPKTGARGLVVAGYEFQNNTVVGNCSYHISTSGSGRGGHGTTTYYYNTCSWDLYGNLLSLTPVSSAPTPPSPISEVGTEIVYAISGTSSTGVDTRGFGFVSTPSAHYSWVTPDRGYAVIPDAVQHIRAVLISDGDFPLDYSGATATASVSGTYTPTPGRVHVYGTNCTSAVAPGSKCSVVVNYNPTTIQCTGSPYGYAYTKIDLQIETNSGADLDFTEGFTITGVPICDGGD